MEDIVELEFANMKDSIKDMKECQNKFHDKLESFSKELGEIKVFVKAFTLLAGTTVTIIIPIFTVVLGHYWK